MIRISNIIMESKTLKERCHIDTDEDGDCFVGVKADSDDAIVYFPLGYDLPSNEQDIRRDIQFLFKTLASFTTKEDRLLHMKKNEVPQAVNFPIQAYLDIIDYYLDNGDYYMEKDPQYSINTRGKTNWSKTIKNITPAIQNKSFLYFNQIVRTSSPNDTKLITQINKYCVYESFLKLGWLYGTNMPEKPGISLEKNRFVAILNDKISSTNNNRDKSLFSAMIAMIKYLDERTLDKRFYFGTEHFEYIWQAMIDKVFGIRNKGAYFPRAIWIEKYGSNKGIPKHSLEPDSIMIIGDKYYVLDAKFYRYGRTGNSDHLPNSSDINKQITYGEYVETNKGIPNEKLFNAFIMPFNMKINFFGISSWSGNVAEATGDWRKKPSKNYEKIQGILVDIRYLMYHLDGNHDKDKNILAKSIENL